MQKSRIPFGSDVSAGRFRCVDCGQEVSIRSASSLPPCPSLSSSPHPTKAYRSLSGVGDAPRDPYPERS